MNKDYFIINASELDSDILNILKVVFSYHPSENDLIDVNDLIIKPPFIDDNDQAVAWYGQDVIDNFIKVGWSLKEHGNMIKVVL